MESIFIYLRLRVVVVIFIKVFIFYPFSGHIRITSLVAVVALLVVKHGEYLSLNVQSAKFYRRDLT